MINRGPLWSRAAALGCALFCCALVLAAPSRSRTVKRLARTGEPVEIVAVKAQGKALEFDRPFVAKDDWPGGLTFVIKNTSAKPAAWVSLALSFRKPKEPEIRFIDHTTYGIGLSDIEKLRGGAPPLKPGETAEVVFPPAQYQSDREILNDLGYPKSLTEVEVSVERVSFEGEPDVLWIEGELNKRDSHSPSGWTPIKQ